MAWKRSGVRFSLAPPRQTKVRAVFYPPAGRPKKTGCLLGCFIQALAGAVAGQPLAACGGSFRRSWGDFRSAGAATILWALFLVFPFHRKPGFVGMVMTAGPGHSAPGGHRGGQRPFTQAPSARTCHGSSKPRPGRLTCTTSLASDSDTSTQSVPNRRTEMVQVS